MDPLVFVHGYLGGSRQWQYQQEYFSRHFEVLTPDLPGFGKNTASTAPDTIGGFADFVLEWLDQAGVTSFHLLGHSMGGMIVQQMVAQAPERVDRLVLYGTGPVGLMPGRFETIEESREKVKRLGVETTGRSIAATWFLHGENGHGFDLCAQIAAGATEQAALAGLAAMEHWSGVEALSAIRSSTLIIWGDRDRAYLWPQPHQLWMGIKGSALSVVAGCSHAVHAEKPHLFNPILLDFLKPDGV